MSEESDRLMVVLEGIREELRHTREVAKGSEAQKTAKQEKKKTKKDKDKGPGTRTIASLKDIPSKIEGMAIDAVASQFMPRIEGMLQAIAAPAKDDEKYLRSDPLQITRQYAEEAGRSGIALSEREIKEFHERQVRRGEEIHRNVSMAQKRGSQLGVEGAGFLETARNDTGSLFEQADSLAIDFFRKITGNQSLYGSK
jgi:hypothetical protein